MTVSPTAIAASGWSAVGFGTVFGVPGGAIGAGAGAGALPWSAQKHQAPGRW